MDEILKRDQNTITVLGGITDDSNQYITMLRVDPITKRLLISATGLPGGGTVTSVSVVTANGISGSVANPTTTPAITLTLGAITPSAVQVSGLTASQILSTDASKNLTSLDTATYPSLTELSYVKGVTSAIQTQLNGKQASGTYLTSTTGITVDQTVAQTLGATGARLTKLWAVDVTVTNAITGSITGNAATVTTNANLTGAVTSSGNATSLGSFSSANLISALTDETGTGFAVFSTSPTLVTPILGIPTSGTLTNCTGLPAASVVAGTLGTGAYAMDTKLTVPSVINTSNAITASANAATVPITSRISTVTNNSAATLTITITTTSAVDGQLIQVRILDFSGVAQTLTFVNTENSTVTVPTTSNGSTTLPLSVLFQFNANTTKWRCIASA